MKSRFFLIIMIALSGYAYPAVSLSAVTEIDRIVAMVNANVIMESELISATQLIKGRLAGSKTQIPPDDVLRKLSARLGGLFGGGRPGGGGVDFGGGAKGLGILALVLVIAWFIAGIYIVEQPEQGVVLRFGKLDRSSGPGPHWAPYFIDKVEKVNVDLVRSAEVGYRLQGTVESAVPHEALMLTEDENIIDIKFAVQYRVKDAANYLFNVRDPDLTLRDVTESAVREIVGKRRMDPIITEERGEIATEAEVLMQEILNRYKTGLEITSVNMQGAQPPKEVQDAFFDAVKAREDQQRYINEAQAYKADIIPKARGESQAIREKAEAYKQRVESAALGETARFLKVLDEYQKAPEITRRRLYIESMESVMANSTKVMVDLEGGNNLLYLPLDRLLEQREPAGSAEPNVLSPADARAPNPRTEESRRQRASIRGRRR